MPSSSAPPKDWLGLSIALYGAFLATVVFFWNVYTWRTNRGKLKVRCFVGRRVVQKEASVLLPVDDGSVPDALLVYNVTNVGTQPITVANLGGSHRRWRGWVPERGEFITLDRNVPATLSPSDYLSATRDQLSALGWITTVFAIDSLGQRSLAPSEDVRKVRKAIARGRSRA